MSEYRAVPVFGRAEELAAIENSLHESRSGGVLIEGGAGTGKTFLAGLIHRRRGGEELWLRGDRVLADTEFGALGLVVDLDGDPADLLFRVISALTREEGGTPVVFVDDAHELDPRSRGVISQLANDGNIRLVVALRRSQGRAERQFADLVADHVLDHVVLGPLDIDGHTELVEHHLGGIVSRGALDILDFHSSRVPGKVVELLGNTSRTGRFIDRSGVWVLDGRDIDYDERTRDVTRIDLQEYTPETREALELVVLAGEVEVDVMLAAGLGEAADALVDSGEIRVEHRRRRVYAAVENHTSETIRYTIPYGRSRKMYEFVAAGPVTDLSPRARMLRLDWALGCGADFAVQELIDAARTAASIGEWQRALRMLVEAPTDHMAAHELSDLGRLYCEVNQAPIGFDIMAQAVQRARCTSIVLEAFSMWSYLDFERNSPTLNLAVMLGALDRLEAECSDTAADAVACGKTGCRGTDVAAARRIINDLVALSPRDPRYGDSLTAMIADENLPEPLRVVLTVSLASRRMGQGRIEEALRLLRHEYAADLHVGTGPIVLSMVLAYCLAAAGETRSARMILEDRPSNDIAYLAARSGPCDLVWSKIHLFDGQLPEATRTAHAAVEAMEHWNQTAYLALAIAKAAYVSVLGGNVEAAADYERRYDALPQEGPYLSGRRAGIVLCVARALRTGDLPSGEETLRELLDEAMGDGSFGLAAHIRLMLFRHFDVIEPEQMCLLAERGVGHDFRLLDEIGSALRDRDSTALIEIAHAYEHSNPDLAERCQSLAEEHFGGVDSSRSRRRADQHTKLTARERQVSSLLIAGRSNSEIAAELGVRVRTVEGHTYRLFQKLGVSRREEVGGALEELRAVRPGR